MSDTPRYRYLLTRRAPALSDWVGMGAVTFVMLNPSTADETHDDPTIRRCMGFARSWGYAELRVVNLFAARATDPRALAAMEDPVGPENDDTIARHCHQADRVIAAWGARGTLKDRDVVVGRLLCGVTLWCLGRTKAGHPRHPLYVRHHTALHRFRPRQESTHAR